MELYGIRTRVIPPGDNLIGAIEDALDEMNLTLQDGDVLVLAESVVATDEGRVVDLESVEVGEEAQRLGEQYDVEPPLMQLILDEADELLGGVPGVVLTVKDNLLYPNAGIDKSNAPPGHVTLLPAKPAESAQEMRKKLQDRYGCRLAVIVGDSRTQPMRIGTVGVAIACAGMEPVEDARGRTDLYGNVLRISRLAMADNLVSAAQLLMGEADEQTPAVVIRGAPIKLTNTVEQVPSMPSGECMYLGSLKNNK